MPRLGLGILAHHDLMSPASFAKPERSRKLDKVKGLFLHPNRDAPILASGKRVRPLLHPNPDDSQIVNQINGFLIHSDHVIAALCSLDEP